MKVNQYKQNRKQRGQQVGPERTSQVELADVYGEQLFTPLEQLVSQLAQKGVQLENGDFVTIKEAAGEAVAAEAQRLREIISNSGEQRRDLVNWASTAITTSFPEDQQENAFCLILPGQAKRHQFVVDTSAFMTKNGRETKVVVESKQNVRAMLVSFADLAKEIEARLDKAFPDLPSPYGAYKTSLKEGATPMTMGEYLKDRANTREKREAAKQELGEAKGKASWLNNWVEGKPRPGRTDAGDSAKPKSEIEAKRLEVTALKAKITELQDDESKMAGLKNYAKAGEYQLEWGKLQNMELPRLEKELADMVSADELKARVEAAAQVVANAPEVATGTFPVGTVGDAAKAKQALADKPAGPTLAERIAKLKADIAVQLSAVEAHEVKVEVLQSQVAEAALKDANAAIGLLQQVKDEQVAAVTARGLAAKWGTELAELKLEAEANFVRDEIAKAVAPNKPAADTTTQATDDPITTLEAILGDIEDKELTKAAAGLLDAVKLATEKGKGGKRIKTALARFQAEEIDVDAVIADTEALLAIAK